MWDCTPPPPPIAAPKPRAEGSPRRCPPSSATVCGLLLHRISTSRQRRLHVGGHVGLRRHLLLLREDVAAGAARRRSAAALQHLLHALPLLVRNLLAINCTGRAHNIDQVGSVQRFPRHGILREVDDDDVAQVPQLFQLADLRDPIQRQVQRPEPWQGTEVRQALEAVVVHPQLPQRAEALKGTLVNLLHLVLVQDELSELLHVRQAFQPRDFVAGQVEDAQGLQGELREEAHVGDATDPHLQDLQMRHGRDAADLVAVREHAFLQVELRAVYLQHQQLRQRPHGPDVREGISVQAQLPQRGEDVVVEQLAKFPQILAGQIDGPEVVARRRWSQLVFQQLHGDLAAELLLRLLLFSGCDRDAVQHFEPPQVEHRVEPAVRRGAQLVPAEVQHEQLRELL
mmetsp:Transcript_138423/g.442399  ORF Transcript_138423/g.442399 Transcript_138423/m.442399 type:complete len:399 (+) Transcript_138423:348-1544(+)